MTLSTFFGLFWKGFDTQARQGAHVFARQDSPDIATQEAHYERARHGLRNAHDIATLEARMKLLEAERPWW